MEQENKKGKRIPFFFTPIPRFAFDQNIFQDQDYFRFLCFAFYKTAFENTVIFHCGQRIDLEPLEFIFGRGYWAEELGLKERKIRTFICQLTGLKLATKLARKSTSKFTVYKWFCEHFPGNFCQQSCQQEAGKPPASTPQIKNKSIDEEQQRPEAANSAAAASFTGKAKRLFLELPEDEREAVTALFYKRSKKQAVNNVEAWFVKCIKEGWHQEEKLELPLEPAENPSDFEKNKTLTKEVLKEFGKINGAQIYLREDFLEIEHGSRQLQIFYSEPSHEFSRKLEYITKKLRQSR